MSWTVAMLFVLHFYVLLRLHKYSLALRTGCSCGNLLESISFVCVLLFGFFFRIFFKCLHFTAFSSRNSLLTGYEPNLDYFQFDFEWDECFARAQIAFYRYNWRYHFEAVHYLFILQIFEFHEWMIVFFVCQNKNKSFREILILFWALRQILLIRVLIQSELRLNTLERKLLWFFGYQIH